MLRPRASVLAIDPYTPGASRIAGAEQVIKLSSNEGAWGPPPGVAEAVAAVASAFHRYPDGGAARLREAIGHRFCLDPGRIVCGAGSDDLLFLLAHIYCGPGTELLMTAHGFSIYAIAGRLSGARVVHAPERDRTADVDALLDAVTPATTAVFLANPNNPTGTMIPAGDVVRLRTGLPEHVLLVLDAAYAEYVERADYEAGVRLVDAGQNTVMTRTFSKMFGMGGLRLGWCYAPSHVVDVLHRARSPFNVSLPAHAAGLAALAAEGWIERCRMHNTRERARVAAALAGHNTIRVGPSEANFLLLDIGTEAAAIAVDEHLRAYGLLVRRVGGYGLPQCLRVTIGRAEENDRLIAALHDHRA